MNQSTQSTKDFLKTVLKIAIPVVLQGMITIGVNLMDTIMLGNYGEIQISASSLANEFINLFQILCFGIGGGAAVLTAQYWGSKDLPKLRAVITLMLRICITIALLLTVATILWPGQIMAIYTNDPAIIEKGILYFRLSAFTYIPFGVMTTLTIVMRSTRQVRLPLITSIIAFFVNIGGNWVFIFGKLGAPEMQIEGAALGTLIARLVEFGIIGGYFLFFDKKVVYRLKNLFDKCGYMVKNYLKYCVPVIISDLLLGLGNNVTSMIIGRLGASFVSANAIMAMIVRLSTVFNQGISNASGTITGNTLGEGKADVAYKQSWLFLWMSVIVGILAAGIVLGASPFIISAYNITAETREIAYQLMYAVAIMVVFQTMQGVTTKGVLRGGGDTKFLLVADVLFLWVVSLPLGFLTAFVWNASPFIIYVALKLDWAIKSFWCIGRMKSRKWMKKIAVS